MSVRLHSIPVMSRDRNYYSSSFNSKAFLICSALLFCGAVASFIWILVNAAEMHFIKNILYSVAFLVISAGVFAYSLKAYRNPESASGLLWVSMIMGIAIFIAGLCIKSPEKHTGMKQHENTCNPAVRLHK